MLEKSVKLMKFTVNIWQHMVLIDFIVPQLLKSVTFLNIKLWVGKLIIKQNKGNIIKMNILNTMKLIIPMVMLSGCATIPNNLHANVIKHKHSSSVDSYHRKMRVSWYSSGKKTANGQHFNPMGNTAAHRTLPFGTRITLTNPHNHRSVTVVVNDRGPFVHGVELDLAKGAASRLGVISQGHATLDAQIARR